MATYDALHAVFADYPLKFEDSYFMDSTFRLAAFLADHYKKIAEEYAMASDDGRNVPPMDLVNNLGFFVLGKNNTQKPERCSGLNTANYPADPIAYNCLGDLYAARGDKALAVASYKKALSFAEDAATRKKLAALR